MYELKTLNFFVEISHPSRRCSKSIWLVKWHCGKSYILLC